MPRLFTGLEIPPDIATELSMLRGGLSGARWIDVENYHLTLRFIGFIPSLQPLGLRLNLAIDYQLLITAAGGKLR